ncbi:endonuclease/exonuclease/phosphatase (EEP) superfamily protein YafD [Nakamurella sp. UYEF19]|uniref:endonuclease/exonuclease/phosphatase family protein n=1 Tax=Nakamurella sp. UYEF19 TaxID=1756392 RepID=UPI00339191C4
MRIMNSRRTGQVERTGNRRNLGTAGLLGLGAGAAVMLDPAKVGLSTTPVLLHALSFRGPMSAGLLASGAGTLLLSRRRNRSPSPGSVTGVTLVAAGLGQLAIMARRGWAKPEAPGRAEITVVTLNTLGGAATPLQIISLVAAELVSADAAVVMLPETTAGLASETARLLRALGHPFQVFSTSVDDTNPLSTTSLLVSEALGVYEQREAPQMWLGAVLAVPVDGSGPTLAAVHPGAPMPEVGLGRWRHDVSAAVDLLRAHPHSIVAGDFNATVDHEDLRDVSPGFDAAVRASRGAEGTWPARVPPVFAAPIDHILLHGRFSVLGTRTVRVGGSDHRAVIARLTGTAR